MTRKYGWSKNVLTITLESVLRKNTPCQTNFDETIPGKYQAQAKLAVRDEYTFDFLELGGEHSERELEKALWQRWKTFSVKWAVSSPLSAANTGWRSAKGSISSISCYSIDISKPCRR
jgi:hypothetical protein